MTDGFKSILYGDSGTGKTWSIPTLLKAKDLEVFVVFTENGDAVLNLAMRDAITKGWLSEADRKRLHVAKVTPVRPDFSILERVGKTVSISTYESLAGLKGGLEKTQQNQFLQFLALLRDFKDHRTGETFGPVDSWDSSRILVLDSMSGTTVMIRASFMGAKPCLSQGEYQVIGGQQVLLFQTFAACACHVAILAHAERERDELAGIERIFPSASGRKTGPELPKWYNDVILAGRSAKGFGWNTASANAMVKNQYLPSAEHITPDWSLLHTSWLNASI